MLLIVAGGGYVLARRSLQPVQTMTQTARQITADRLNERIDVDNPDPGKEVRWGPQTWEEMMIGWFDYTIESQTIRASK